MVARQHSIEIGRVVQINYGRDSGLLAVILDIVDQSRALIDGPYDQTGVSRQTIPLRNLSLTPIKIVVGRGARSNTLLKAFRKGRVLDEWKKTSWSRKASARYKKSNLTDFQRFKVRNLMKQRSNVIKGAIAKIKGQ